MSLVFAYFESERFDSDKGINFGGKYIFTIDKKGSKYILYAENNPEYIEDFYDIDKDCKGTITNVSAIVGRNGSGKSTLLNYIYRTELGIWSESTPKPKCILIYNIDGKYILSHKDDDYIEIGSSDVQFQRNTSHIDLNRPYPVIYEANKLFTKNNDPIYITKPHEGIQFYFEDILIFISEFDEKIQNLYDFMLPEQFKIKINFDAGQVKDYFKQYMKIPNGVSIILLGVIYELLEAYNALNSLKDGKIQGLDSRELIQYICDNITVNENERQNINELLSLINEYQKSKPRLQNNKKSKDEIVFDMDDLKKSRQSYAYKILHCIHNIQKYWRTEGVTKNLDYDAYWEGISSGELSYLYMYSYLYKCGKKKRKAMMLLLDEPELSMHPEWQRTFLDTFLRNIKKIIPETQLSIILTSNTPFIISDIPRNNVIFLKKDDEKQRQTRIRAVKIVAGQEFTQTFGANIHTLLANSFFLNNGTIGEFSRKKIREVIEIIENHSPNKENINRLDYDRCKKIISFIGEPIVRGKLEQMLEDIVPKELKIEYLEDRIKAIEDEIKNLRG